VTSDCKVAIILVVDDERPLREFLAASLEQGGHRVVQAHHGRHALSVIGDPDEDRPDLVISDVMMPLVSGVELCRILKADPDTAGIPVVLMSAASRNSSAGACADGYIAKPFDLDVLDKLIERLLSVQPPDRTSSRYW
jgi:DNA-binding response OmpR family regulator